MILLIICFSIEKCRLDCFSQHYIINPVCYKNTVNIKKIFHTTVCKRKNNHCMKLFCYNSF